MTVAIVPGQHYDLPMATQQLRLSRQIPASAEQVWAVLTDIEAAPRTLSDVLSVEVLTPGPYAVGTRWLETRKMFGFEGTEEMEVAVAEEPRRTVIVADAGGAAYRTEFLLSPISGSPDAIELTMVFSAAPQEKGGLKGALMGVMAKVGMKATRKAMEQDLEDIAAAVARS